MSDENNSTHWQDQIKQRRAAQGNTSGSNNTANRMIKPDEPHKGTATKRPEQVTPGLSLQDSVDKTKAQSKDAQKKSEFEAKIHTSKQEERKKSYTKQIEQERGRNKDDERTR